MLDSNKEQANFISEQVAAQLKAYFGPMPHAGSSASSSDSAVDKKLKQATKLRKGAEIAAAKAAKEAAKKAKDTERAAEKEERAKAKAELKRENAIIKLSKH